MQPGMPFVQKVEDVFRAIAGLEQWYLKINVEFG
jgi:hypothetical protein